MEECSSTSCISRRGPILRSLGCLSTPLLEARCTAGACIISSTIEDGEDEASRMLCHSILIAGGTSLYRCLRSTEILSISRPVGGEVDMWKDRRCSVLSGNSESFESVSNFGGNYGGYATLTSRPGPQMRSPRGRLGLAALQGVSSVYAIGGCNGNNDLATVER